MVGCGHQILEGRLNFHLSFALRRIKKTATWSIDHQHATKAKDII